VGLKDRRKIIKVGHSEAITLPPIVRGEYASIAANRLLLIDPREEISEDKLHEFLEKYIEPVFWEWFRQNEAEIS